MTIEPCPFCNGQLRCVEIAGPWYLVLCINETCGYRSGRALTMDDAIAKHNAIARDHAAAKKAKANHV